MVFVEKKIPVMLYHRIIRRSDIKGRHKIYVYEDKFYRQMKLLKDSGYSSITFEDIHYNKALGNKNVIITFDDGYEDNYNIAFPILKEFGFTAVIFLVTGLQQNEWGISAGEPALPMMNEFMLKEMLEYGFELGGHTQYHPDLTKTNTKKIIGEISGCKTDLEQRFQKSIISFAYPYGGINPEIKKLVAENGFIYGISTNTGPDNLFDDLLQIKRKEIGTRTTICSFRKKAGIASTGGKSSFINFFCKNKIN
jgi:peptidoglycan/xylan/chitin deacetylase (PgdA/CDA1 family)